MTLNKEALGGLFLFIIFLMIAFTNIVYPALKDFFHTLFDPITSMIKTPSENLLPYTTTIIHEIFTYVYALFSNPYAVAILIFISILLILLEFKW